VNPEHPEGGRPRGRWHPERTATPAHGRDPDGSSFAARHAGRRWYQLSADIGSWPPRLLRAEEKALLWLGFRAYEHSETGEVTASVETLASRAGLSARTARGWIRRLEMKRFVLRVRDGGGRHRPNNWVVDWQFITWWAREREKAAEVAGFKESAEPPQFSAENAAENAPNPATSAQYPADAAADHVVDHLEYHDKDTPPSSASPPIPPLEGGSTAAQRDASSNAVDEDGFPLEDLSATTPYLMSPEVLGRQMDQETSGDGLPATPRSVGEVDPEACQLAVGRSVEDLDPEVCVACYHTWRVHGDKGQRGCMAIGCSCEALVLAQTSLPDPVPGELAEALAQSHGSALENPESTRLGGPAS